VIVLVPALTTVTKPVSLTVATAVLLEVHVTVRPVSTMLFASFVTAVICCVGVIPRTRLTVAGLTVTVATGAGVTVRGALPLAPSLVAMIFAVPALTAVTSPEDADTIATAVLSEAQTIVRSLNVRPCASSRMAVAWVV
jgi:hypothetical protein